MNISERAAALRRARGLNKKQLAEVLHVAPSLVSGWEIGTKNITAANQQRLADFYGVTLDYLTGRSDVPNPAMPILPRLSSNLWPRGKTRPIPVLGTIRAGEPILTERNIETDADGEPHYEEASTKIVGEDATDKSFFFLRVQGDSMNGARIMNGDLILVHEQPIVENGEIAVVMVGVEEAVLKRVYWRNGAILLVSENSSYEPIVARPEDVRIIGKVKKCEFEPK